jgi:membrane-associated protein
MSPRHVAPDIGLWIVLKEEVIFAFVIDQPIWIIHPVAIWCEVKLWAIFLVTKFASWMRNHGTYLILTGMEFITNLFDASAVVSTLGLIGVLAIIFMETGLLIGLVFPGGEVVFLAGIAASGAGSAVLGDAKLSAPWLFALAPIAAIVGGEVGYWFGKKYGRRFFDRPDSRFFNQKMVNTTEKWLLKYGPRKALIFGRFIPFARTLINPVCGVVHLERKLFSTWNAIGAIIWTQVAIGIGYLLGDAIEGSVNKYLYPIIALIVLVTLVPLLFEIFKEWQSKRYRK